MSLIKDRILQYAVEQGFQRSKFPEKIGMSASNFRGKSSKTGINSEAIAEIVSIFPEIDLHWLITGEPKTAFLGVNDVDIEYDKPCKNCDILEKELLHAKEIIESKNETIEVLNMLVGVKKSKAS